MLELALFFPLRRSLASSSVGDSVLLRLTCLESPDLRCRDSRTRLASRDLVVSRTLASSSELS